jgi:hypothetical protein
VIKSQKIYPLKFYPFMRQRYFPLPAANHVAAKETQPPSLICGLMEMP